MLKNHPRGLKTLFFTEMWERFGFYTMMAVFTLYMEEEFHWDDVHKGNIYGLLLGAVYFAPVLGGWIADRFLGHRNTIRVGALILSIGYFALSLSSIDRLALFYLSIVVISLGTGLFKANISVLVGNLYQQGSPLKDVGYNIFYMGINTGAFLGPLSATVLHNIFHHYNMAFAAAAVGLILSAVIFELGKGTYLHADNVRRTPEGNAISEPVEMSRQEVRGRLASLAILFSIVIFFWMAFYQNGFALTLFALRSTVIYDYLRPETYQSFGALFILLLTPPLVATFNSLRKKGKEPSSAKKIFLGMLIAGFSIIVMIFASLAGGNEDRNLVSPAWLITSYFIITIAEIHVSPMGLSFVSKVAPPRMRGLMMGCWFGATAIGSYLSGALGAFYSALPHHLYFTILAALLFLIALVVLAFLKKLKRFT